jgi:hypothetical protein
MGVIAAPATTDNGLWLPPDATWVQTEEPYLFSDRTDAAKRVWLDDVYAGRA